MTRKPGESSTFLRAALAALCGAVILAAAGCGSSNEQFTSAEADRALAALDAIQENVDQGRCAQAARRVNTLAVQAAHVNSDRPDLGDAYASSVARLQDLVQRECVEIAPTSATPEVTPSTGNTGSTETPAPEPTGGGTPAPDTGGGNENNGGGGGNNGGGNQNQTPDNNQPDNSGGAAPGL